MQQPSVAVLSPAHRVELSEHLIGACHRLWRLWGQRGAWNRWGIGIQAKEGRRWWERLGMLRLVLLHGTSSAEVRPSLGWHMLWHSIGTQSFAGLGTNMDWQGMASASCCCQRAAAPGLVRLARRTSQPAAACTARQEPHAAASSPDRRQLLFSSCCVLWGAVAPPALALG